MWSEGFGKRTAQPHPTRPTRVFLGVPPRTRESVIYLLARDIDQAHVLRVQMKKTLACGS